MNKFLLAAAITSLLVISGVSSSNAQGVMTTWIGDSVTGYSGDGGPANLASIYSPHDVCFDAAGNFYFVDQGNNVIRKVAASTNIITTVVGNGTAGYSGDGDYATSAMLNTPQYMCIDGSGNIYFSDGDNSVIRKVTKATGKISTIAGNGVAGYAGDGSLAINAMLDLPQGICLDASGNVYVADEGNNVVRKINVSTGIITTVAGSGVSGSSGDGGSAISAQMNNPMCVCFDAAGNLYIADEGNYLIRKVAVGTGIISTIAGNGLYGFSGDGGQATNGMIGMIYGMCMDGHGCMYIDDISCSCRKIDLATGVIHIVAGDSVVDGYNGDGGSCTTEYLNFPEGLCIDPVNGTIVIADIGNNRIRRATQPTYTSVTNVATPLSTKVFPNPSSGRFTIQTSTAQTNASLEVYNTVGENVYATTLTGTQNNIDISNQPAGIYYLNIRSSTGTLTQKITVNK